MSGNYHTSGQASSISSLDISSIFWGHPGKHSCHRVAAGYKGGLSCSFSGGGGRH